MKKFLRVSGFCVLVLILFATRAGAQQFSAVSGVVSDKSGGTVAGVIVTLDNPKLGIHAVTSTNDIGYYQFLKLAPASGYQLTLSKDGFREFVLSNLTFGVGTVETRNAVLELGDVKQRVEVTVTGEATLDTADAAIGSNIETRSLRDLPSLFRGNPASLLTLVPGVVGNVGGNGDQEGSVTGSRADQMALTLDGVDVTDQTTGEAFAAVGTPPIDSIAEVRTVAAGAIADLGRSSGGQVQLVTKSGTNEWHGSAREFHRNTIFSANDFFSNAAGVARPPLIRNQFGASLGGPVKKDRFFFFFDYEGRRDARSSQVVDSVPTDNLRQGDINYINQTGGVSTFTSAQVQALDPAHAGANAGLLALFAQRYPEPNDLNVGDGLNTAGFRFNAPVHANDNTYTTRLDYNISQNQKLFLRATVDRFNTDDSVNSVIQQFPGDPAPLFSIVQQDYVASVGHTWTITPNLINQASFGMARSILDFPVNFKPTAPNLFIVGGGITDPFGAFASQGREVPVPDIRDDLTWTKGKHTLLFGTNIKPIHIMTSLTNDYNFISVGLGGNLLSLDPTLRPSDINTSPALGPSARTLWDGTFTALLGFISVDQSNFNYTRDLNPLPSGSGKRRDFKYNEYEFYGLDSWRFRSDLTLTFGLRWQIHSTPYEVNGFQSVPSIGLSDYFAARVAAANSGASGVDSVPLVSYDLGGSANHRPGYYKTGWHDFAPRVALAYAPSFRDGLLGALFGDRKTSLRVGAGIVQDRIVGAPTFELDQNTFLFDNSAVTNYGSGGSRAAILASAPRFTDVNTAPPLPSAPSETKPNTPNVDDTGFPIGLPLGGGFPSFFNFDPKLKTPYSIQFSFGFQRELRGNMQLEVDYVGRLGRRLLAVGDSAQTLDAKDAASGQFLRQAFTGLQSELRQGVAPANVTPQPWFENQCFAGCTSVVANALGDFVTTGDLSTVVLILAENFLLNPNVALPWQTGANGYIGNFGSSNYNGMLVTLRKRYSNNLQMAFNYTLSRSIDNVSTITNSFVNFTFNGAGLVCDLQNLRTCRGDSAFDARHVVSSNFIYDLPFGHGQRFGRDINRAADAFIGGWSVSGIVTWRTGFPFGTSTGTFPIDFTQDAPAVFNGDRSAIRTKLHTASDGSIQMFADPDAAFAAFGFPTGGGTGNRNVLRGLGYSNVDLAVLKNFRLPWSEQQKLQFRCEAFNLFNHTSFANPGSAINGDPTKFGVITAATSTPRQLQFGLRFDF